MGPRGNGGVPGPTPARPWVTSQRSHQEPHGQHTLDPNASKTSCSCLSLSLQPGPVGPHVSPGAKLPSASPAGLSVPLPSRHCPGRRSPGPAAPRPPPVPQQPRSWCCGSSRGRDAGDMPTGPFMSHGHGPRADSQESLSHMLGTPRPPALLLKPASGAKGDHGSWARAR